MVSSALRALAIVVGVVSPLVVAPPAVAAQIPRAPRDSAAVRVATERAWARLADGLRRGDPDAVAAVSTPDAAVLTMRTEVRGRAALHAYWAQAFERAAYDSVAYTATRYTPGTDVAVEEGTVFQAVHHKVGPAAPKTARERYLAVWRRQLDGAWLLDTMVQLPALPATETTAR